MKPLGRAAAGGPVDPRDVADVILVGKLQHEDRKTDYGRERIAFLIGRLVKYK